MLKLGELMRLSSEVVSKHGVRSYGRSDVFKKEFGEIYYSDKVAYYNEEYKVLELRMVFGSKSDTDASVHAVRLAFFDVEGIVYNSEKELKLALGFGEKDRSSAVKRRSDLYAEMRSEEFSRDMNEGIIIPCTSNPSDNSRYSDNFQPNGKYFYSKKGITLENLCKVSCTCPSYRYTFAQYNYKASAHLGTHVETYKNALKTGQKREAKLNMNRTPGLCKHLMLFATLLAGGEILKGYMDLTTLRKDIQELSTKGSTFRRSKKLLKNEIDNLEAITDNREHLIISYKYDNKPVYGTTIKDEDGNTKELTAKEHRIYKAQHDAYKKMKKDIADYVGFYDNTKNGYAKIRNIKQRGRKPKD